MIAPSLHPPDSAARVAAPVIAARSLLKSIDERVILRDLTISIGAGEYIAILGNNGAGKSTLMRLLAGLTAPTDGELSLFGQTARTANASTRRRIGLIDHQPMLYRDLTAAENLEFFARLYGLSDPRDRPRRILTQFGLGDRLDDPVKSFSRGMTQRVAIARALIHDPQLILADEPFAGLDAQSVEAVEDLFRQLSTAGKTIVLINHDIEQTLRLVDRVAVLRGGTIALDQPAKQLGFDDVLAEVTA